MSGRHATPTPPEPARDAQAPRTEQPVLSRELLRVVGAKPGPTLIVLAGIHGNEPAGLHALQRLEAPLRAMQSSMHGAVVAFAGNLGALELGVRYRNRDLNRMWTSAQVADLTNAEDDGNPEREEQRALVAAFENTATEATGPVVCLDLHTSSADGPPFAGMGDTLDARRFGLSLGVPVILGLAECIEGSVMEWFAERGRIAVAFEGGSHNDPVSVDHMESGLWLAIRAAGLVPQANIDPAPHEQRLAAASRGVPRVLEVFYRHNLTGEECFVMRPGMQSFQEVVSSEELARDTEGPVLSPRDSHLLLPLYQGKGNDGFFLAKPVSRLGLWWDAILRRTGIANALSGGTKVDGDADSRHVRTDKASRFRQTMWRAAGYRHVRVEAGKLRITRRWSRPDNAQVRPRNGRRV